MKISNFFVFKEKKTRVIVTSNCQTASICSCLRLILGDKYQITPLPLMGDNNLSLSDSINIINQADIWVTLSDFSNFKDIALKAKVRIIKIPRIRFNAFHPDIVYIKNKINNSYYGDYHSFIVIWGFINGLDQKKVTSLFNSNTFENLDYFSMWNPSKALLGKSFESSDIDFNIFFQNIQKHGVFMHTINHPKISLIVELSYLIRDHIEPNDLFIYHGEINDPLNLNVWPVYPEIGDFYSYEQSGYIWKCGEEKRLFNLESYIKFSYENYKKIIKNLDHVEIIRSNFDQQNLILKDLVL